MLAGIFLGGKGQQRVLLLQLFVGSQMEIGEGSLLLLHLGNLQILIGEVEGLDFGKQRPAVDLVPVVLHDFPGLLETIQLSIGGERRGSENKGVWKIGFGSH